MLWDILRATGGYWRRRDIDWVKSYWNLDHPHRDQLMDVLMYINFNSVLEVGCGAGVNLYRIREQWPGVSTVGIDINEDAVRTAAILSPLKSFGVGTVERIPERDKSFDVVLTDACLIYVPPWRIRKAKKEMIRVARKAIVMVEWHSCWGGFRSGHWVRNYKKLFKEYETTLFKVNNWEGGWKKYGHIIYVKVA